jgi:hypothetical protein
MPSPDMSGLRRMLAELDRPLPRRRPSGPGELRPAAFARFSDPLDRYTFMYPSSWTLRDGASPTVSSPTLGLFARVDFLPADGPPAERLSARFPGLSFRAWRDGTPARGEGRFVDGPRAFAWTSWVFDVRRTRVVLSTGAAEGPVPPTMKTYRRNILAALRRHFRLSAGLRA